MSKSTYTQLITLQRQWSQGLLDDHGYYHAVCNLILNKLNEGGL